MQSYFTRREPSRAIDYEESYWGTIIDPDGNSRDRLRERQKHLEDVAEELEFLNSLQPGRVLDVGCGLGYLLSGLTSDWDRHGVEVSRFAAEHAAQWGQIHVGELHEASYPAEHFDVVVMHHVIEHIEDPMGAIVEVRRILKPGGFLLLGTPDFDSGCARRFGSNYRLLHDPTHVSLFSNESMHRFLRDHGFEIDRVEYPFFNTRYFTEENLMRLFDTSKVSPPFYGNFMTFYCHKPERGLAYEALMDLSTLAASLATAIESHVADAARLVVESLRRGGKVLACGNGGSAADAQHFVAELVGRMARDRPPLPGIALSSDPSVVTAIGNDYGFDRVFARQVEGLGQPGDVLLGISTSGHSPNVLSAIEMGRQMGMRTVALVGEGGEPSLSRCDVCIAVPSSNGQRVQELHTAILHAICECVDELVTAHAATIAQRSS